MTDDELIERALAEDVGDGDATTAATVDADARARATITQKAPGVISGLDVAEAVFRRLDPDAETVVFNTGDGLKTLDAVADRVGPAATIEPTYEAFKAAI